MPQMFHGWTQLQNLSKFNYCKCYYLIIILMQNMFNLQSTPPPAGVPPVAPTPPAAVVSVPPAPSQIVAFEAYASSPPAPSTQPTPPVMPTSSTHEILTRLLNRGNKLCKGLGYTPMRGQGCKFFKSWYERGNHSDCPNQVHQEKEGQGNCWWDIGK
ncbi:hypothetical protein PVK06_026864 [Gossypium arboreum]|uniref:Uncharacterized protein n=1 Tax=Gossypium arboreum TaxID=29729 RepID=A0ABR0P1R0_GOSAR|nr:hypothetical protein PVK06_026864 [Gossypium arboreum]